MIKKANSNLAKNFNKMFGYGCYAKLLAGFQGLKPFNCDVKLNTKEKSEVILNYWIKDSKSNSKNLMQYWGRYSQNIIK